MDLAPGDVNSTFEDYPDENHPVVKAAQKQGVSKSTAVAMATGVESWLHMEYYKMSQLTYKKYGEIKEQFKSLPERKTKKNVATLTAAVAGLKVLPPVSKKDLTDSKHFSEWDGETVRRYISVPDKELEDIYNKYKPGEDVEEVGMLGTTFAPPDSEGIKGFASKANVSYVIRPKLDGTGSGRYVDKMKRHYPKAQLGEILYPPGAKFKVSKLEKDPKSKNVTIYMDEV